MNYPSKHNKINMLIKIIFTFTFAAIIMTTTYICPQNAYAVDASDSDYADTLLSNDGKGNGTLGWNENIIEDQDGYEKPSTNEPKGIIDNLWKILTSIVTTILSLIIFVFVLKISVRACLSIILKKQEGIPDFFRSGNEKTNTRPGSNVQDNTSWFKDMCKEFVTFFGFAAGTSLILGIIIGLISFGFSAVPEGWGNFNAFNFNIRG